MSRAAIISIILNQPHQHQRPCNDLISEYSSIIRGRMGIPFEQGRVAMISLTVVAELDAINGFIKKLGELPGATVKAAITDGDISQS
ncbi:MAG: iron-only hydrogenase system regulator [Peptococcaceae bacterium]|nr:iron-only hydrogenase system regulator [Peptococcaceae bacterium]